jgi:hypothetical protein
LKRYIVMLCAYFHGYAVGVDATKEKKNRPFWVSG